jgi:hypothetical protein
VNTDYIAVAVAAVTFAAVAGVTQQVQRATGSASSCRGRVEPTWWWWESHGLSAATYIFVVDNAHWVEESARYAQATRQGPGVRVLDAILLDVEVPKGQPDSK